MDGWIYDNAAFPAVCADVLTMNRSRAGQGGHGYRARTLLLSDSPPLTYLNLLASQSLGALLLSSPPPSPLPSSTLKVSRGSRLASGDTEDCEVVAKSFFDEVSVFSSALDLRDQVRVGGLHT
jgi:hypothetical protein